MLGRCHRIQQVSHDVDAALRADAQRQPAASPHGVRLLSGKSSAAVPWTVAGADIGQGRRCATPRLPREPAEAVELQGTRQGSALRVPCSTQRICVSRGCMPRL